MTRPPIRDQNARLSCTMTYRVKPDNSRLSLGAGLSASLIWDSAAGTSVSNNSTALPNNVGETLRSDVLNVPTGTEISSHNCTAMFRFTDTPNDQYTYALNTVSWKCVSAPVLVWCTYSHTLYYIYLHVLPKHSPGYHYFNSKHVLTLFLTITLTVTLILNW